METILIHKIIVVLIDITGILLAAWVLFKDKHSKLNRLFVLMTFPVLLWVNVGILCQLPSTGGQCEFFAKLGYAAAALFFIPFYLFSEEFFETQTKRKQWMEWLILAICGFAFIFAIFNDLVVIGTTTTKWGDNIPVIGKGGSVYFSIIFFLAIFISSRLILSYAELSKEKKLKVQHFLLGLFVFILMNIVFNVILSFWQKIPQYYQFGNYSVIFLIGFTAYAIVKHELFGIKVILAQVLVYMFAILLLVNFFVSSSNFEYFIDGFLFVLFIFFGHLFIKSVFKEIEDKKKIEKLGKKLLDEERKLKEVFQEIAEERAKRLTTMGLSSVGRGSEIDELRKRIYELEGELRKTKRE